MKNFKQILLILAFLSSINCQNYCPMPYIKTIPKFSYDTIKNSSNLYLYEDTPLETIILHTKATTYDAASPVRYEIKNGSPFFRINETSGDLILFNSIKSKCKCVRRLNKFHSGPSV